MEKKHLTIIYLILAIILILTAVGLNKIFNMQKIVVEERNALGIDSSDIADIESNLSAFESKVSELKTGLSDIESSITGLKGYFSEIESSISGQISSLSDFGSDVSGLETSVSGVKNNITVLKNNISDVESNISMLDNSLGTIEQSISEQKDSLSLLGSNMGNLGNNVSEVKANMSEIESAISVIDSNISDIDTKIDSHLAEFDKLMQDLKALMDSFVNPEDAKLFLEKADETDYPDLYYLAAIYHDPSNPEYYKHYFDYLESIEADTDSYIMLGSIIENSIMSGPYATTNDLLEIYNKIMDVVSFDTVPETAELTVEEAMINWNEAVVAFYDYANYPSSFSYQTFENLYNNVSSAETDIYEIITSEDEAKFADISSIYSLIKSGEAVENIVINMNQRTDSVFLELYPFVAQNLDGVLSLFASRDTSIENTYVQVISDVESDVINNIDQLDYRYDDLQISIIEDEIAAIPDTLKPAQLETEYNEILIAFSTMVQNLRQPEDFSDRISNIQSKLETLNRKIYANNYASYQQWAGAKIASIARQVEEKDKERKLFVLAAGGYFNIDKNLLIPELATAYSSLWNDDYEFVER